MKTPTTQDVISLKQEIEDLKIEGEKEARRNFTFDSETKEVKFSKKYYQVKAKYAKAKEKLEKWTQKYPEIVDGGELLMEFDF